MFAGMFCSDVFVLKCNLLCSQKMTGQSRCQFSELFSFFLSLSLSEYCLLISYVMCNFHCLCDLMAVTCVCLVWTEHMVSACNVC